MKGVCEQENIRHQDTDGPISIKHGNVAYMQLMCSGCDRVRGLRLIRKTDPRHPNNQ